MDCPSGNDQKSALRGYAPTAGVNEQAVFAIVAQESSFGDFDAVGNNVMQINDRGQSVEVRNLPDDIKAQIGRTDGTIRVVDIFPQAFVSEGTPVRSDPNCDLQQNIMGGLLILRDKIMSAGGNVEQGIHDYNSGDEYINQIRNAFYQFTGARLVLRSGTTGGSIHFTTDEIHQYWLMCTFVVFLCFAAYKVCTDVSRIWSGSYQLR